MLSATLNDNLNLHKDENENNVVAAKSTSRQLQHQARNNHGILFKLPDSNAHKTHDVKSHTYNSLDESTICVTLSSSMKKH